MKSRRVRSCRFFIASLAAMPVLFPITSLAAPAPPLAVLLEPIRARYHLPALAGAIFNTGGLVEMGAVGVRKIGDPIPVTTDDLWHLGSDTKAMTATLAGTFVAEKKLSWDAKVVSFFPEIAEHVPAAMKDITLGQVLAHHAGLKEDLDWNVLSKTGTLPEQRLAAARLALSTPAYAPGAFHYANTDYVVIGAILEKLGGKSWEELIRERLFQPLGMTSAGFGGTGTPGKIDQPWPHLESGDPLPINGPLADLPAILRPAGGTHATMTDWARFLTDQVRGGAGMKALLPAEIYQAIQTDHGDSVGYGWGVQKQSEQPWAGGKMLSHAGSNGMNYCLCLLAPSKKFGVLVCTNEGGDKLQACNDAAVVLINRYLLSPAAKP